MLLISIAVASTKAKSAQFKKRENNGKQSRGYALAFLDLQYSAASRLLVETMRSYCTEFLLRIIVSFVSGHA